MNTTEITESRFVTDILDALPVGHEATTSRVVVNNPAMRVVYFAFDAGQMLTDHSSPRAVIVTILDGEFEVTVDDQVRQLRGGDLVYLAPSVRHAVTALTAGRLSLVMVDLEA